MQVGLLKFKISYHFVENLAHLLMKIELLFTMLSNFERELVLKDFFDG